MVLKSWNYAGKLRTKNDHRSNAIIGLVAEAGEVADIFKKLMYHSDSYQERVNVREEIVNESGDVLFYFLKMLHEEGITVEEVLEYNRKKIMQRHPKFFPGAFVTDQLTEATNGNQS